MVGLFAGLACMFYLASAALLLSLEVRLPLRDLLWRTISSHALGGGRLRFDLYGILMMAGVVCQAVAIRQHGGLGWVVPLWLLVLAVMLAGLLLYPTDSKGVAPGEHPVRMRQRAGVIHLYFAGGCFLSAAMIVLLGQPKMALLTTGFLLTLLDWIAIMISAMLIMMVPTGFWAPMRRFFGLAERAFFYSAAMWFTITALVLTFGAAA